MRLRQFWDKKERQKLFSFPYSVFILSSKLETSLVIRWLRLCTSNAGGLGSIPGQGAKLPCASQRSQKIKKKKKLIQQMSYECAKLGASPWTFPRILLWLHECQSLGFLHREAFSNHAPQKNISSLYPSSALYFSSYHLLPLDIASSNTILSICLSFVSFSGI